MSTYLNNKMFVKAFTLIYTSRIMDSKMMNILKQGKAYFHMGASGHEAVQAAASLLLKSGNDWIYPYYRDQVLCLGLDMSPKNILRGFLAKKKDPSSGGRQLPNHYGYNPSNIVSSSSSVGTQYLQAVGTALANKKITRSHKKSHLTIVCGGEGSTSQGEFYEAVNWAIVDKVPVVFLIQDNKYAISVPSTIQKPNGDISIFGKMYNNLNSYNINGCNFIESYRRLNVAFNHARLCEPVIINSNVIRLADHSSSDDQTKYREIDDLKNMAKNDPLFILKKYLISEKILSKDQINLLQKKIIINIEKDIKSVLNEQNPDTTDVMKFIYSEDAGEITKVSHLYHESHEPDKVEYVFIDAVNKALRDEMKYNDKIYVFGEDVAGEKGGVFKATRDLTTLYGEKRCFNTQLAEASIIGVAIGMAIRGIKPVVEIQFGDYIWPATMQIRNELSTMRYRSNNQFSCSFVIRTPIGGYIHGGLCHSQNIEAFFSHIPGIKILQPSNALDAYNLLRLAINCKDPIIFLEHKFLYRQKIASRVIASYNVDRIGQSYIVKQGNDLTIISYGYLLYKTINAASNVEKKYNVSIEVIDLVSIQPVDWKQLFLSIRKTNKCLIVHEDHKFMGFGAELSAEISNKCFDCLDAPVYRHTGLNVHIPYNATLEDMALPQISSIEKSIETILLY